MSGGGSKFHRNELGPSLTRTLLLDPAKAATEELTNRIGGVVSWGRKKISNIGLIERGGKYFEKKTAEKGREWSKDEGGRWDASLRSRIKALREKPLIKWLLGDGANAHGHGHDAHKTNGEEGEGGGQAHGGDGFHIYPKAAKDILDAILAKEGDRSAPQTDSLEAMKDLEGRLTKDYGEAVKRIQGRVLIERDQERDKDVIGIDKKMQSSLLFCINEDRRHPLKLNTKLCGIAERYALDWLDPLTATRKPEEANLLPYLNHPLIDIPEDTNGHDQGHGEGHEEAAPAGATHGAHGAAGHGAPAEAHGDAHDHSHEQDHQLEEQLRATQHGRSGNRYRVLTRTFEEGQTGGFPGMNPQRMYHLMKDLFTEDLDESGFQDRCAGVGIVARGGKIAVSVCIREDRELPDKEEDREGEIPREKIEFNNDFWRKSISREYLNPNHPSRIFHLVHTSKIRDKEGKIIKPPFFGWENAKTLYDYFRIYREIENLEIDHMVDKSSPIVAKWSPKNPPVVSLIWKLKLGGTENTVKFYPGKQTFSINMGEEETKEWTADQYIDWLRTVEKDKIPLRDQIFETGEDVKPEEGGDKKKLKTLESLFAPKKP